MSDTGNTSKPQGSRAGKKEQLIAALMVQPTTAKAAQACGISARTAHRWIHHDPAFQLAHRHARREVLERAVRFANAVSPSAVQISWNIANNAELPPSVRLCAIGKILQFSLRGFELTEVTGRFEAIEAGQAAIAKQLKDANASA